ncbi:MAG: beta-galactosidase trimerization domain-containing protein, partial [Bacteroidales bacterium]|nr:beta-galactosidase trimerization domain-containing protein [Bacteroidales bacterium]
GKRAKEYRAIMGKKPIGGIFSMGLEEPYRWKDSVQSEAEVRVWVAEGTANGMRPWFTKFSGTLYDERWLSYVEDIYNWHYKAEVYLRNEKPLANVGMVYSEQTQRFYGGEKHQENPRHHEMGMYHALIEARIPFEMVHEQYLDAGHIDQFKVLVLPNIAALSDQQCQNIRDYVNRGGSLLATFETSLYNELGEKRSDFGLGDVFGVSFDDQVEGPMKNSYLRCEKENGQYHQVLDGLQDTSRIINGIYRLDIQANSAFPSPLTLIPSYPDLPMEHVYPRIPRTDIQEIYLREIGQGRIVYFPWDIDRTFWEILNVDHGKLIRNAVHWAMNEEQPVTVLGQGILDVTIWQQQQSMTVHLVNFT